MNYSILYLFIASPLLALSFFLIFNYYYSKSQSTFIECFFFGMISVLFVALVENYAEYKEFNKVMNLRKLIFYCFFIIGFFSEFGKILVFSIVTRKRKKNTMLFYIACSMIITLGFLTTRNIQLFYTSDDFNLIFAVLYIFMNLIFAFIIGYFAGIGSIYRNFAMYSFIGFLFSGFFHGLFIMCLYLNDIKLMIYTSSGALFVCVLLFISALKNKLRGIRG